MPKETSGRTRIIETIGERNYVLKHIVGYTDKFSVRPGGLLNCMVSTDLPEYDMEIVKISSREGRSLQPEINEESVPCLSESRHSGRKQATYPGSFIFVPGYGGCLSAVGVWYVNLWVYPTYLEREKEQVLLSVDCSDNSTYWSLAICGNGQLKLEVGSSGKHVDIELRGALGERSWSEVLLGFNRLSSTALLGRRKEADHEFVIDSRYVGHQWFDHFDDGHLLIAARSAGVRKKDIPIPKNSFNGRIDDISVYSSDPRANTKSRGLGKDGLNLLSRWDLNADMSAHVLNDSGELGRQAVIVNTPTRAVTGHKWDGTSLSYVDEPRHFSAIHFHEDDMSEAGWEVDRSIAIPENFPSGVYAVKCKSGANVDYLPFAVAPNRAGRRHRKVAVLLPSLTYLAYANIRKTANVDFAKSEAIGLDPIPELFPEELSSHPEWGKSLYDLHLDGSGCMYASWHRPLLNVRPGHKEWLGGFPRNFSADLFLLHWLKDAGIDFDVLTDYELHDDGLSSISGYRVVLTGSHPEYCTGRMLDSLQKYIHLGGRLMYLGGNGFYWVTSIHPNASEVMEVRRGYAGTRAWTSHPAEVVHSTTGERGGLWRHRGRPPNDLVGVGFTAQGFGGSAAHYCRMPSSFDPLYSWIFDGLTDTELIGDFGLAMNGAAGDEIDRYDAQLGGTEGVVLARAAGYSDFYCLAVEEVCESSQSVTASKNDLVRADMVYMTNENQGAVFSTGSMCWIPALPINDGKNNVSKVTENVLRTFMDDVQVRG